MKQKRKPAMKKRSSSRNLEEAAYSVARTQFVEVHPVCPVTGQRTTQVHHSAKRYGRWLNLQRYWIAVSMEGHDWIEDHKDEARSYGLMVRINQTADEHIKQLQAAGINLFDPLFYQAWDGVPLNLV